VRNRGESGVRESPVRNPAYRLPLAGPLRVGNRPCERIGRPKHGHPLPSPKLGHHVSPRADPALERAPHPRPAGYAPEPASAVLPAGDAAALEAGHLPGHGSPSLPPRAATGSRGSAAGLACARLRVQRERRPFRERLAEVAERLGRALAGGDPASVPPRVIARRFAASMEPLHVCRGNPARSSQTEGGSPRFNGAAARVPRKRPTSRRSAPRSAPLQWSRCTCAAETAPGATRGAASRFSFNGAAARVPRKPRSPECSGWFWICFNGAAARVPRKRPPRPGLHAPRSRLQWSRCTCAAETRVS